MPMMVVTEESFAAEAERLTGKKRVVEIKQEIVKVVDIMRGRGHQLEVPHELRVMIAQEALEGTPAKQLSNAFGISESSISAYKNGATSTTTYNKPDKQLAEAIDEKKINITDSARSKLMLALEHITPDKVESAKLRDIAQVAQSMSGIMKNMEPTNPSVTNNTQVIVYKPRTHDEDEYETITVNE